MTRNYSDNSGAIRDIRVDPMNPQEALKSIGLGEKEAAIYLAALELGQETVSQIAKKAGIKRPTAYLILDSLSQKGLINTSSKGKKILYGAESPEKLNSIIAEKQRALKTAMPFLQALNNSHQTKPQIRFYEGQAGVRRIYDEIFAAREMRFWGSIKSMEKEFVDVLDWFVKKVKKEKPKVFDLLVGDEAGRVYAKKTASPNYEIRFLPEESKINIDSVIFGDKLAFIAFSPNPHGLIIESEDIVNSFRALWQMAWNGAVRYKSR